MLLAVSLICMNFSVVFFTWVLLVNNHSSDKINLKIISIIFVVCYFSFGLGDALASCAKYAVNLEYK